MVVAKGQAKGSDRPKNPWLRQPAQGSRAWSRWWHRGTRPPGQRAGGLPPPARLRGKAARPPSCHLWAAWGSAGFGTRQRHRRNRAPLRRDTDAEEVADASIFLLSSMGRGITGQVLYVDGGYCIMGD